MKHFLYFIFFIAVYSNVSGQKTLGVGVTTPNPKAVLDVDSPTKNQGMLIPRLNTSERTGISLGLTEAGLIVYDTDLKTICSWDGTAWILSGSDFPIDETITNTVSGSALLRLVNNGTAPGNFGVASFENTNSNSSSPVVSVSNTSSAYSLHSKSTGTGENAWFEVSNATSSGSPVIATTNGTGLAGLFQVTNKSTGGTALEGATNSDVGGTLAPVGVYGLSTGAGSLGGAFRINNPINTYPALYSETNGLGSAASFKNINASNNASGLYAETNGGGAAVYGINTNTTASFATGVMGEINTSVFGIAVFGRNAGTGGYAGSFEIQNAANTGWGVKGMTIGTGAGVYGLNDGTADGLAGLFENTRPTNAAPALQATTVGSGAGVFGKNEGAGNGFAGLFITDQASNTYPAIQASTAGSGPGVRVIQDATAIGGGMDVMIQNATNSSLGFSVDHQGTGNAGSFNINNAASPAIALFSQSNGTGPAITANQTNNGLALNVTNGGLRYNVTTVSSAGSITSRSAIYNITTTGTFTLGWSPTDGDVIYVNNTNGGTITFAGLIIPANGLSQLIYIGGWKMNN